MNGYWLLVSIQNVLADSIILHVVVFDQEYQIIPREDGVLDVEIIRERFVFGVVTILEITNTNKSNISRDGALNASLTDSDSLLLHGFEKGVLDLGWDFVEFIY